MHWWPLKGLSCLLWLCANSLLQGYIFLPTRKIPPTTKVLCFCWLFCGHLSFIKVIYVFFIPFLFLLFPLFPSFFHEVLLQILACFSVWTKILFPPGGGVARIYIPLKKYDRKEVAVYLSIIYTGSHWNQREMQEFFWKKDDRYDK